MLMLRGLGGGRGGVTMGSQLRAYLYKEGVGGCTASKVRMVGEGLFSHERRRPDYVSMAQYSNYDESAMPSQIEVIPNGLKSTFIRETC